MRKVAIGYPALSKMKVINELQQPQICSDTYNSNMIAVTSTAKQLRFAKPKCMHEYHIDDAVKKKDGVHLFD